MIYSNHLDALLKTNRKMGFEKKKSKRPAKNRKTKKILVFDTKARE